MYTLFQESIEKNVSVQVTHFCIMYNTSKQTRDHSKRQIKHVGGSLSSERVMELVPHTCSGSHTIPSSSGGRRRVGRRRVSIRRRATAASRRATMRRQHRVQQGGGNPGTGQQLGCSMSTNYAPYNFDNYDQWRGNAGGSTALSGATIPQNPLQKMSNWVEGKTTIFNPGTKDPTVQNQVNYMSQQPSKPIRISSLQNPSNVDVPSIGTQTTNGVMVPGILENNQYASVFPKMTTDSNVVHRVTPMARAGKRRRNRVVRRRSRRQNRHTRRRK